MYKFIFSLLIFYGVLVTHLTAQSQQLTGTVEDKDGVSIVGATVLIAGTNQGAFTDEKGSFSIRVNPSDTVVVSYLGFESVRVPVANQPALSVVLLPKVNSVDEVVIIGYGEQTKKELIAAVDVVKGEDIVSGAGGSSSLGSGLVGQLTGLNVLVNGGEPGAEDPILFVRGQSTWNGGEPLILVDGVERPFNDINPNEIESISLLKDASATAVFGVKGANGVLLITTKRGKSGKPSINITANATMKQISKIPAVNGSYDGLSLRNQAIEHEIATDPTSWGFYTPEEILNFYRDQTDPERYPDVDWGEVMTLRQSWSQQANVSLSGGTQRVRYFSSLGFSNETDVMKTEDIGQGYDPDFSYRRFNFRTNLDFDITPTTTVSANLSGWVGFKRRPTQGTDGGDDRIYKGLYEQPPDQYPVQYSNGAYGTDLVATRYLNPFVALNLDGYVQENRTQVFSDFSVDQKLDFITPGLSLNGRVSFDNFYFSRGPNITDNGNILMWIDPISEDTVFDLPGDAANLTNNYDFVPRPFVINPENINTNDNATDFSRILFYQGSINYRRTFAKKHTVSFLGLMQRRQSANDAEFRSRREDWVARITYGYDNKYLFEANGAYNGSEKFDTDFKFGFFPSAGVGWVISEEKFFDRFSSFMNYFKVRYTYGLTGSDQGIGRRLYLGGYEITEGFGRGNTSTFGSPIFQNNFQLYNELSPANPEIGWEVAVKQNIGVETSFLNSLISVNFDYFWESRDRIFMSADQRNQPDYVGFSPVAANIGETTTKGFELRAIVQKYYQNTFSFRVDANYNHAIDQIIFREDPELLEDYRKLAGFQIGQTTTQVNQPGFINSWDEMYTGVMGVVNDERLPGDFRQIDYNADGVIDEADVIPWGFPSRPQFQGNLNLQLGYKGFTVSALFVGVHNVSRFINLGEFNLGYTITRPFMLTDAWTPERAAEGTASYPHIRYQTGSPKGNFWVNNASYLRFQTAEVAYNFNPAFLTQVGIRNLRVFINGNNLYIWSYIEEDRDTGNFNRVNYPRVARYNFGVNVTF